MVGSLLLITYKHEGKGCVTWHSIRRIKAHEERATRWHRRTMYNVVIKIQ